MKNNIFIKLSKQVNDDKIKEMIERWDEMYSEDIEAGKHPYYFLESLIKIACNDINEEVKNKFKAEDIPYWDDFISDAAYVLMEMKRIREDLKYTLK